jgi:DNA repair exonuclease SbcCD ATPase subunit
MSAIELNERLTDLSEEITEINEQTKLLTQKRTSALSEQNEEAAKTIRRQLQELQERLEDVTIMKTAVQGKLRIYSKNKEQASEIRKRIAGELWPQGTKVLSKIQQAVADVSNALHEIDQLNGSMQGLAVEHEKLIGETIPVPLIPVPYDLRGLVAVRLPELPETLQLKVHSQEVREAQERQETAFTEHISKQKTQILPYLKSADMAWPKCKVCSRELVCIGGSSSVQAGSQQETVSGESEAQEKAFTLLFRCKDGQHNGREGFIKIENGPCERVRLIQLEIER